MRPLLAGAACALLAGCAGSLLESDTPADRIYSLQATAPQAAVATSPVEASIAVARPRVAPGLATERIAVRTDRNEIDYYRGARWGGTAAEIVQSFLVQSLRESGAFALVAPESAPVAADFLLDLELKEFHADQTGAGPPVARFSVVATLIEIRTRRAVLSFVAAAEVPAEADRMGAVVEAMERAANQAAGDLADRMSAALR
ncbi:MAG TPA: ABC-type transport auxiliary lipoprotein family protein [Steroidobacteraceae bacterium]|nr:ABC-type transport auxiliary lipoprotein family protein [Steroidobacteraceae bacterium]